MYGWAYASLKPYIDLNTNLRKKAKNDFEEDFFKLMNNSVFGKAMKNLRKHGDKKLEITERRRHYLVSEPNYHKFILWFIIRTSISNRNEKNIDTYEWTCLFRTFKTGIK